MYWHFRNITGVFTVVALFASGLAACGEQVTTQSGATASSSRATDDSLETAIFAAGCFWCVEDAFDQVPGVVNTISGYIGGHVDNPSYEQVSAGGTGHTEALQVEYDPQQVGYAELLEVFWRNVDATDAGGQFCDRGSQYRSGVYYLNDEQKSLAMASKLALQKRVIDLPTIVTEITEASAFFAAEDYHQDYYLKNPIRYKFYKTACGRVDRLNELWGKG